MGVAMVNDFLVFSGLFYFFVCRQIRFCAKQDEGEKHNAKKPREAMRLRRVFKK
jgi:hypothetical protein